MITVLQRVIKASITVDKKVISEINGGLLILLGVMVDDTETDSKFLADKIAGFRIFNNTEGKMNRSIIDVGGSVLVVSQFTLCAEWLKGRRPSFIKAAPPQLGEALYKDFMECLRSKDIDTQSGQFGAMMEVALVNDGPVTFVLNSKDKFN